MEIPSRTKLRAQRIFGVFQVNIFWQKTGLYLAAHTERYQKMNVIKNKEEVNKPAEIKYLVWIFLGNYLKKRWIPRPPLNFQIEYVEYRVISGKTE